MLTHPDRVAHDHTAAVAPPCTTSWHTAFRVAWAVYLPVRLLLSLCGAIVMLVTNGLPAGRGAGAWLGWLLVEPWAAFDVDWYTTIASTGYGIADGRAAFHPLLPLLMRLIGDLLGGQYVLAGLLASNGACLVLLATLYRYVALDHGARTARAALWWLLATPVSFTLLIPYTESLLLCLTLLALWCARHDRWLLAGICGATAALTKQPGVVLVLPLLWEYVSQSRPFPVLLRWRTLAVLACLALIPLGYLSFSLYRGLALGDLATTDARAFMSSLLLSRQLDQTWATRFGWPWEWAAGIVAYAPAGDWLFWLHLALVLGGTAVLLVALRRERGSVMIYSIAQVLMGLTMIVLPMPLLGLPRRVMLAFPIFTQLSGWSASSALSRAWLALGLTSMLVMAGFFVAGGFIP